MNRKRAVLIGIGILVLAAVINYFAGMTILINDKQVMGMGGFIAAYVALVLLTIVLIFVIPSAVIVGVVLILLFGIFLMMLFPLLPFAFPVLPIIVVLGFFYLIYKKVKGNSR